MKIIHWSIIFIIIIIPFSLVCRSITNNRFIALKDEVRINNAIDTATTDATDYLLTKLERVEGKNITFSKGAYEGSIEQLLKTMAVNLNLQYNSNTKSEIESYIPAIIIVGYDGLYVYSAEIENNEIKHILKPKIPYSYEEGGLAINFTLDNYATITILDNRYQTGLTTSGSKTYSGYMRSGITEDNSKDLRIIESSSDDLSKIVSILRGNTKNNKTINFPSFLKDTIMQDYEFDINGKKTKDASPFHKKRREVIINLINSVLSEEVNEHNSYAAMLGIEYTFVIPEISNDEWINTISDISILAFIQGIPIGINQYYNNYALGGARIIEASMIYCTKDGYYHQKSCEDIEKSSDGEINYSSSKLGNIFYTKNEAVDKGYYWCTKCKP